MSLLIEGRQPRSVSYSGAARAVISPAFAGTLSRPPPGPFLVTVSAGISGPLSFVLECSVAQGLAYDIVLVLFYLLLLAIGFRLDVYLSSLPPLPTADRSTNGSNIAPSSNGPRTLQGQAGI
ncbi:hypothetical protein B0H13DRAFT_1897130 [Mycena leptocephala]|nr:hypothetical protein B0H13DRAFT_1897130 [Mycena leptocephala]